jgi:hypothetical protein
MNLIHPLIASFMLLLLSGLIGAAPAYAQELPVVESANPSSAVQGTYDLSVEIQGSNFGRGAVVRFLANCDKLALDPEESKPPYCDNPAEGVTVGPAKAKGSTKLTVSVSVSKDSYVGPIDIEVDLYGRKGKGTTFSVQAKDSSVPSDCMLDFDATFDDLSGFDGQSGTEEWVDGVRSDNEYAGFVLQFDEGPYYAFGGTGLRLDTNGSMNLETNKDTRFITIDFSNSNSAGCVESDSHNPAGAAGFCIAEKGTDMRFEHQVQNLEDNGLCQLQKDDEPMRVSMGFSFLQSPEGMLTNEFKNGRQNGGANSTTTLRLNYGCQALNLLQSDLRIGQDSKPDYRAVVTRIDDFTWRIQGEWACLHTNLGHKLVDGAGDTVYLRMPFGLTIVDVNAPPGN